MRRRARVDTAHPGIVADLRAVGASVQSLAPIGRGVPDLLVFFRGHVYLIEVKSSATDRLTADEAAWHAAWRGQVAVVWTTDQALEAIGATAGATR